MSLDIILPEGFRYAATYAGIRKVAKDDLALIVSDAPASAAAVFTKNLVVAAPVEVARRNLRESRGKIRAWLINAGKGTDCEGNSLRRCRHQRRRLGHRSRLLHDDRRS